jgi:hypothetical protein
MVKFPESMANSSSRTKDAKFFGSFFDAVLINFHWRISFLDSFLKKFLTPSNLFLVSFGVPTISGAELFERDPIPPAPACFGLTGYIKWFSSFEVNSPTFLSLFL